ncbi:MULTISPECIES: class I SAM-dependent DNA methyltransferase [Spirosoma]|uniref:Methyltransferase domain-containing protein n=1 Tax=Spirosoma sordidisoli TaxID=2502893 RepID=A0A4Q2UQJ2_9BACT|nr:MULTISPECIES: SAM-dependent methyltransferase [Spirosoma]RYC69935.1 methyltransferase domain-containing protein [Spirosoma sordidisoli]
MATNTLPATYFDDVYRASDDPWAFATSPYERAKYEATVAALPNAHYHNGFEIGCSIGVLSEMLARRCEQLLSVDASELPLKTARQRLAPYTHVSIEQMAIPDQFPDGPFDLILLSEVGYYLSLDDLTRARQRMIDTLSPGGHLLLVHWTPVVPDYPLTGDQVHDHFMAIAGAGQPLTHRLNQRADTYRLDLFQKQL